MSNDKLPTADAERLSNEIIAFMTDHGLTPDEMLQVIRLAREKYKHMKNGDNYEHRYATNARYSRRHPINKEPVSR